MDRTVERFGDIVVVSYPRRSWDKSSAWTHLEANRPEGVPRRVVEDPTGQTPTHTTVREVAQAVGVHPAALASNPWRKQHTSTRWVWRYDPAEV